MTIAWSFTASPSTATAEPRPSLLPQVRAATRVTGLFLLFLACAPLHFLAKAITGQSSWPPRFLGAAGWIIGARARQTGTPVRPRTLLISNHVSWLDILVLGGTTGCAFVSKDSLGNGFLHWLADQNGTIYVRREKRADARDQALTIAGALGRSQPLALFPEGTTGPGDRLLPFRPTLLEAAAHAGKSVEIRPVAIDYGPAAAEIGWHGESGKSNVVRILGRSGTLPVTVRLLEPLAPAERKTLAAQARSAIEQALAAASSSPQPVL